MRTPFWVDVGHATPSACFRWCFEWPRAQGSERDKHEPCLGRALQPPLVPLAPQRAVARPAPTGCGIGSRSVRVTSPGSARTSWVRRAVRSRCLAGLRTWQAEVGTTGGPRHPLRHRRAGVKPSVWRTSMEEAWHRYQDRDTSPRRWQLHDLSGRCANMTERIIIGRQRCGGRGESHTFVSNMLRSGPRAARERIAAKRGCGAVRSSHRAPRRLPRQTLESPTS